MLVGQSYLVEFEDGRLTIIRRSDGNAIMFERGAIAHFRQCVKESGLDKTIACYIRLGRKNWKPMYKPSAIPALLERTD